MGDVHVYPLTPRFAALWSRLAASWDRKEGFRTPHGSLRVALCTTTGRMVIFAIRRDETADDPATARSMIISDGPLDPGLARICFDEWQRRHFGDPGEDKLSRLVDFDNAEALPLADLLERDEAGYITGPWWWKDAIGWSVLRKLAPHPLGDKTRPKKKKITFTITTGGTLLAWHYPWIRTTKNGPRNRNGADAMGYVSVRGETRRGYTDAIVRIDCHVTRVARSWANVKTVHLKHPRFPVLLKVPVRSYVLRDGNGEDVMIDGKRVWKTVFRGRTADIVQACELEPIALPESADGDLGTVRGVFRNKGKHPVGKGPGAYFTLRMATHIKSILKRDPVIYKGTDYTVPESGRTTGPIPTAKLPAALRAAGWDSLRIAVLYAADSTPQRILQTLHGDYGMPLPGDLTAANPVYDGATVALTPQISITLCKVPELTMHGRHDRGAVIRNMTGLKAGSPDDLVAAICETTWKPGDKIIYDGKPLTRRALAQHRVPSQFIVAADPVDEPDAVDHPARAAIQNLLRSCGLVDNRLSYAVGDVPAVSKKAPMTEPITLVGIHLRQHRFRKVNRRSANPPRMVAVLTAVHLDSDPDACPRLEMYIDGQWLRFAEGLTALHAAQLGNAYWSRDDTGGQNLRDHIDAAYDSLILPPGTRRVVTVMDKEQARGLYPALDDNPTITAPLPGLALTEEGVDAAVIRIASAQHAARPATAYREGDDLEISKPSYWMRVLFVDDNGAEPTWLLTQASHQHQGAKSPMRTGTHLARETSANATTATWAKTCTPPAESRSLSRFPATTILPTWRYSSPGYATRPSHGTTAPSDPPHFTSAWRPTRTILSTVIVSPTPARQTRMNYRTTTINNRAAATPGSSSSSSARSRRTRPAPRCGTLSFGAAASWRV